MTEDELKKYFDIYTYCWKLFRKYSNPVKDDSFWNNLILDADNIVESSSNKEFSRKIVTDTVSEIERLYKTDKRNHGGVADEQS